MSKLSTEELSRLIGQRFGSLTVIDLAPSRKNYLRYLCKCDCGKFKEVYRHSLTSGKIESCGCVSLSARIVKMTKHGHCSRSNRAPEYSSWTNMKGRCCNPKNRSYHDYGGRGITICDRWIESFENFYADMGPKPSPKHSLDREHVSGNYEPENCRWATAQTQLNNTRRNTYVIYENKQYTLAELARYLGLGYQSFVRFYRKRNLPLDQAIARAKKL